MPKKRAKTLSLQLEEVQALHFAEVVPEMNGLLYYEPHKRKRRNSLLSSSIQSKEAMGMNAAEIKGKRGKSRWIDYGTSDQVRIRVS